MVYSGEASAGVIYVIYSHSRAIQSNAAAIRNAITQKCLLQPSYNMTGAYFGPMTSILPCAQNDGSATHALQEVRLPLWLEVGKGIRRVFALSGNCADTCLLSDSGVLVLVVFLVTVAVPIPNGEVPCCWALKLNAVDV